MADDKVAGMSKLYVKQGEPVPEDFGKMYVDETEPPKPKAPEPPEMAYRKYNEFQNASYKQAHKARRS